MIGNDLDDKRFQSGISARATAGGCGVYRGANLRADGVLSFSRERRDSRAPQGSFDVGADRSDPSAARPVDARFAAVAVGRGGIERGRDRTAARFGGEFHDGSAPACGTDSGLANGIFAGVSVRSANTSGHACLVDLAPVGDIADFLATRCVSLAAARFGARVS